MIKVKDLTTSQIEVLCRVYDYLISLAEAEPASDLGDEDGGIAIPETRHDSTLPADGEQVE